MIELVNNQNETSKETWLDRLAEERQELGGRLVRLEDFIRVDAAYERLDREDRELLVVQREYMRRYAEILDLRIVRAAMHKSGEGK